MKSCDSNSSPLVKSQYFICICLDLSYLLLGLLDFCPISSPFRLQLSHIFPFIGLVPVAKIVQEFFSDGRSQLSFCGVVMALAVSLSLQFQVGLGQNGSCLTHINSFLGCQTNHSPLPGHATHQRRIFRCPGQDANYFAWLLRKKTRSLLVISMLRGAPSSSRNRLTFVSGLKSLGNLNCMFLNISRLVKSLKVVSSPNTYTKFQLSKLGKRSSINPLSRHSTMFLDFPHDAECSNLSPLSIINNNRNEMRPSKGKTGSLWIRGGKPQAASFCINDIPDLGLLRRETKKIEIMTRMQKRAKTNQSSFSCARPKSTNVQRTHQKALSFKEVEGLYQKEKSMMRETLTETQPTREQTHLGGLLGEWQRYQQLSKRELIQKLISLEHLANAIFKRNKHLEQELEAARNGKQL